MGGWVSGTHMYVVCSLPPLQLPTTYWTMLVHCPPYTCLASAGLYHWAHTCIISHMACPLGAGSGPTPLLTSGTKDPISTPATIARMIHTGSSLSSQDMPDSTAAARPSAALGALGVSQSAGALQHEACSQTHNAEGQQVCNKPCCNKRQVGTGMDTLAAVWTLQLDASKCNPKPCKCWGGLTLLQASAGVQRPFTVVLQAQHPAESG